MMRAVDQFSWAVDLVAEKLQFRISGEASEFRAALDKAGKARFSHSVELVRLWARPDYKGVSKYRRLMYILRLVTPEKAKGTKYRNPQEGAAVGLQEMLDEEFKVRLAREP